MNELNKKHKNVNISRPRSDFSCKQKLNYLL